MTITILSIKNIQDSQNENTIGRHCEIAITDRGTHYKLQVGGLPIEGSLQDILDARLDSLLRAAKEKDEIITTEEIRRLLYRSSWSSDEFQEAIIEKFGGEPAKLDLILAKREAIRDSHPQD